MTTAMGLHAATDAELWRRVCEGSREAFEVVVRRHQGVVSGVAYNACGDLATSEDVAQEAFWAAWRGRESLRDPSRLRPWLCGIARNLGANAARQAASRPGPTPIVDVDVAGDKDDPAGAALGREEQELIWRSLEALPDSYREPLILFYREDRSVAEVAGSLDLSEDVVKQRLARGRGMLRDRLAEVVEEGLRRSRPGRPFTAGVMAGLGVGLASKPAAAGVVGVAAPAVAPAGLLGGLLGSLVGLGGAWLGAWFPAQAATTAGERELILGSGRRLLVAGIVFAAAIVGLAFVLAGTPWYLPAWLVAMAGFQGWLVVEILGLNRRLREARKPGDAPAEPNRTAVRRGMARVASHLEGRSYRSRLGFLGLPLVDVQVSDPPGLDPGGVEVRQAPARKRATGWIAVGDDARGVLLAVGGRAVGGVAIGGRAIGLIAFGGAAVGAASLGGVAVGGLALGGVAVGGLALGGAAFGWVAVGGLAVGAYAAGGAALGWKLAVGGLAVAREVAIGGGSISPRPVDPAAAFRWLRGGQPPAPGLDGPIASAFRRILAGGRLPWLGVAAAAMAIEAVRASLMYRRRRA